MECTREWVRVLKPEGSLFVNLGDKYGRSQNTNVPQTKHGTVRAYPTTIDPVGPPKSLLGLPWRYALAATDQLGLILRRDIIWSKPNGLPESVTDRCRSAHEYVFHLVKQPRYFSAVDEIREPHERDWANGKAGGGHGYAAAWATRRSSSGLETAEPNPLGKLPGSVWTIPSQPLTVPPALGVDHFAAFPMELPRRIIAGWSPGGVCTGCGQGRRPVSQFTPEYAAHRGPGTDWNRHLRAGNGYDGTGDRRAGTRPLSASRTITAYTCPCDSDGYRTSAGLPMPPTRPSVIVDPFGGTGTTALVASALGRHGITIDMSADYTRLARWRCNDPAQRAAALQVPKPPPIPDGQDALFAL